MQKKRVELDAINTHGVDSDVIKALKAKGSNKKTEIKKLEKKDQADIIDKLFNQFDSKKTFDKDRAIELLKKIPNTNVQDARNGDRQTLLDVLCQNKSIDNYTKAGMIRLMHKKGVKLNDEALSLLPLDEKNELMKKKSKLRHYISKIFCIGEPGQDEDRSVYTPSNKNSDEERDTQDKKNEDTHTKERLPVLKKLVNQFKEHPITAKFRNLIERHGVYKVSSDYSYSIFDKKKGDLYNTGTPHIGDKHCAESSSPGLYESTYRSRRSFRDNNSRGITV